MSLALVRKLVFSLAIARGRDGNSFEAMCNESTGIVTTGELALTSPQASAPVCLSLCH